MWSYWIVDHSTRAKLQRVTPSGCRWDRKLNEVSPGKFTFVVDGIHDWNFLTFPWGRIVVACWNDVVRYAGYIESRVFDDPARTVTVDTKCIREVLSFRFPFAVIAGYTVPAYPEGTLTISGRSYSGAIRAALADQITGGVAARWDLPIVLPADGAGPITRTFWNYEFWTIESILSEFENAEDGPDIDFEPRWSSAGTLEWVCRVGFPRLDSGGIDWVLGGDGGITDLVVNENAQKYADGMFAIGKGSETDMRVAHGGGGGGVSLNNPVYRVVAHPHKALDDLDQLAAQARADGAVYGRFTKQWSFDYMGSVAPGVGGVRLGSKARVWSKGSPFITDGWHNQYVIGFSGDMTTKVSLEVQGVGP